MAVYTTTVILLAMFGCCLGHSLARSVQTSEELEDDDAGVTQDAVTSDDVVCDVPGCHYDLNLYCLTNGVIVMGSCSLKKTLCTNGVRNGVRLASGWDVCFRTSYSLPTNPFDRSMVMVYSDKAASTDPQPHDQGPEHNPQSSDTQDIHRDGDDDDDDDRSINDDDDVDTSDNSNNQNSKEDSVTSSFRQQKQDAANTAEKSKGIFSDLSMADLEAGQLESESVSKQASHLGSSEQKEHAAMETGKSGLEEQLLESLLAHDLTKVKDSA